MLGLPSTLTIQKHSKSFYLDRILWTFCKKMLEKYIVITSFIKLLLFVQYRRQLYLKLHISLVKHSLKWIAYRTRCIKLELWGAAVSRVSTAAIPGSISLWELEIWSIPLEWLFSFFFIVLEVKTHFLNIWTLYLPLQRVENPVVHRFSNTWNANPRLIWGILTDN